MTIFEMRRRPGASETPERHDPPCNVEQLAEWSALARCAADPIFALCLARQYERETGQSTAASQEAAIAIITARWESADVEHRKAA